MKRQLSLENKSYSDVSNLTSVTMTQETPKQKNNCNWLSFQYPTRTFVTYFEWPWNVNGGFFSWVYKKWEVENKKNKTIWCGRIIFGFKTLSVTYTCGPIQAYLIWTQNNKRLVKYLIDLCKETPNDEDDVEKTRLFK